MKKPLNKVDGIISVTSRGTGYVKVAGQKEDIEVDSRHLNTALHGDTVEVLIHPKSRERVTGEVAKIISRAKSGFAGVLEEENKIFFLKPDDSKMYTDIIIPRDSLSGASAGEKVFAEIVSWKNRDKAPIGKVVKVLGRPGDNDTEMFSIAMEKGFAQDFPEKVLEESQRIKKEGIKKSDYGNRRDFREILTFTIDPADAKDFDDAISFKELSVGKYEIGVHIADVSHYVRPGSHLDEEARNRGTSVYLVDRTIPMLPEELSNDLCSLVPHKDRLTMSAVFVIDKNAHVSSEWYGRTVINSKKRFSYEEAEKAIHSASLPYHRELSTLNTLAKKLTKERFAKGAISLDQEEVKFVLDPKGVPIKVIKKVRGDSNRLIEELMLLANKYVAQVLSPKKHGRDDAKISIYRVHDLPSKEKMADLAFFLRSLGYKVILKDGIIPSRDLNSLIERLEREKNTMQDTVHRAIIRSMAKAVYSTKNIGHYGLAFPFYTHFTSPIRRYPDIMVHRLLAEFLKDKDNKKTVPPGLRDKLHEYERTAILASEQEKRAMDAERASIKYKQVEYMSRHIGKSFEGVIAGITEWGMYVEEKETKSEGMIRLRDLEDDYYVYNEKRMELVGQKKKKKFRFGDRVKIKVKGVDIERKTIDYVLV